MIKIRIFSSFGNEKHFSTIFQNVFDMNSIQYKNRFKFVNDESYTHAILINLATPNLKKIPKENIIAFSYEPKELLHLNKKVIDYMTKNIDSYYIGNNKDLPNVFKSHYGFMWHLQGKRNYIDPKNKVMSIIFSNKNKLPGHKYRHHLVEEILKTNLPIDIFGKGCETLNVKDTRIKGKFGEQEPYLGYKFSIAIENTESDDYISEKFTNCIAMSCVPVYWGAKNVERYFGNKCYYRLTGDVNKDMNLIKLICNNVEKHLLNLTNARFNFYYGNAYLPEFLTNLWCSNIYYSEAEGHWRGCFRNDKLCNINIPKNGSSTLRKLFNLEGTEFDSNKNLKTIVVIRNPMTRIVSSYMELLKLRNDCPWQITENTEFYKQRGKPQKSFELFLDFIKNNYYDPHLLPQYHFLTKKGLGLNDIDYVINFDNFNEAVQKPMKDFGIDHIMIHNNPSKKRGIKTEHLRDKIYELYEQDFILYENILLSDGRVRSRIHPQSG